MTELRGARWWKVDFHAHSPSSFDFNGLEGEVSTGPRPTVRDWLMAYMSAEIDVIVIADHNTHDGIDIARTALGELREEQAEGFRELVILPGVEITTNGAVHLLGVFDVNEPSETVNGVLHRCNFEGTRGTSDATTAKSFLDVAGLITDAGGLAIPAHADGPAGFFGMDPRDQASVHQQGRILAVEMVKQGVQAADALDWVAILGSDAHHLDGHEAPDPALAKYPGSHFTWVKMGQPNLAGIRVALSDGRSSFVRSIDSAVNPNMFDHAILRSIAISHDGDRVEYPLSPWLNAVIGGRGTGKSTLVEMLRLALGRSNELPERLLADLEWFSPRAGASRAWDASTEVEVLYVRLGKTYRVLWQGRDPGRSRIQEQTSAGWLDQEGEARERFPILINSQKQIYEMAADPQSLLKLIDQQPEIDYPNWQQRHEALVLQYRTQCAQIDEVRARIADESRMSGNLEDAEALVERLGALRDSPEARELDDLRSAATRSASFQRAADAFEASLESALAVFRAETDGPEYESSSWMPDNERFAAVGHAVEKVEEAIVGLADSRGKFEAAREAGEPKSTRMAELTDLLREMDVPADTPETESLLPERGDPYGLAIERRDSLREDLDRLKRQKAKSAELESAASATLQAVRESRNILSQRRKEAINSLVSDDFKLKLFPQADQGLLDHDLRQLTRRSVSFDTLFDEGGLRSVLQNPYHPNYVESVDRLKALLKGLRLNGKESPEYEAYRGSTIDARFVQHLQSVEAAQFDVDVSVWFPEDRLQILYRQEGAANLKPLDEGSPGQKTAALLALVLQLGTQPLILDQPEDDLDNRLIYDLVVRTLKRVKVHRQIVVVTHNANVVVNADAELVTVLEHGIVPLLGEQGAIQESAIRDAICLIMEGGETAFQVRYKRLIEH